MSRWLRDLYTSVCWSNPALTLSVESAEARSLLKWLMTSTQMRLIMMTGSIVPILERRRTIMVDDLTLWNTPKESGCLDWQVIRDVEYRHSYEPTKSSIRCNKPATKLGYIVSRQWLKRLDAIDSWDCLVSYHIILRKWGCAGLLRIWFPTYCTVNMVPRLE